MTSPPGRDPDHPDAVFVIVPARPGPLAPLAPLGGRRRDDIDEALDDLFGEPDDRGPGSADSALVLGGVAAIVVAQTVSLPTAVTVCGGIAIALGCVLPMRSVARRVGAARRARALRTAVGDGVLLRADDAAVARLLSAHGRLLGGAAHLAHAPRRRVEDVAHAAVHEVATLLSGRTPTAGADVEYVSERAAALEQLAATIEDPRTGDGESDRRRAVAEARREVEALTGRSSVTDARDLSRELLGRDDD